MSSDGVVSVVHQIGAVRRSWEGRVLSLAVHDLSRAFARSGFPAVRPSTAVPGTRVVRLERGSGGQSEAVVVTPADIERSADLDRLVAVFESIGSQVSGGELGFLRNVLPVVVASAGTPERTHTWLPARRALLDEWDDLDRRAAMAPREGRSRLRDRQDHVGHQYAAGLPAAFVGRCPYTGAPAHHYLDPFGLDGLWWASSGRYRPAATGAPETLVGLTGSLRLRNAVEATRFEVRPGPEVPFALPSLLRDEAVLGVLAAVRIGPHDGVAITYYAPEGHAVARPGTWGSPLVAVRHATGRWGTASGFAPEREADFDLRPWVEAERLLWVAPKDAERVLRVGADGCPFLDLPGDRRFARLHHGVVSRA